MISTSIVAHSSMTPQVFHYDLTELWEASEAGEMLAGEMLAY